MEMKHDLSLGKLIEDNASEYFQYYVATQYPSVVDGLKAVHRRIIFALKDVKEPISNTNVISKVFKYHPHSQDAIYETIVRMSQPFYMQIPLFKFIGNNGSYNNPTGYAAARYTKGCLSQFAKELFFKDTNLTTLTYRETEDLSSLEPIYLIPKIPTALMFNINNVGYGFTSRGLNLEFEQVCNLAIEHVRKNDIHRLHNKLIPHYYGCIVRNFHDVVTNYNNNDFMEGHIRINLESIVEIIDPRTIVIRTVPITTSVPQIENKLLEALKNKNHWLHDVCTNFKNLSDRKNKYSTKLVLTIKRNVNIFEIVKLLYPLLTCTYSVFNNFEYNKHLISNCTILKILSTWYNVRRHSMLMNLRQKLINIKYNILRLKTYLIIRDDIDYIIDLIKTNDEDTIKSILFDKYKFTYKQCDIIMNANLRSLTKNSIEDIRNRLKQLHQQQDEIVDILKDGIDDVIVEQISTLKKQYTAKQYKYLTWNKLRQPIGLLHIDNGYVLVESRNELLNYKNSFKNKVNWYINFITNKNYLDNNIYISKTKYSVFDKSTIQETKYSTNPSVFLAKQYKYSLHINYRTGRAYIYDGIISYSSIQNSNPDKDFFTYITKHLYLLTDDWNIEYIDCSSIIKPNGKTFLPGTKYRAGFSYHPRYPSTDDKPYVLVFKNNKINQLILYKLTPQVKELKFPSYGKYILIDIIPNFRYRDNYYYIDGKWLEVNVNKFINELQTKRRITIPLTSKKIMFK